MPSSSPSRSTSDPAADLPMPWQRGRFPMITRGKTGHVTDGLVLLAAWAELLLLLGALAFFVLRRGGDAG